MGCLCQKKTKKQREAHSISIAITHRRRPYSDSRIKQQYTHTHTAHTQVKIVVASVACAASSCPIFPAFANASKNHLNGSYEDYRPTVNENENDDGERVKWHMKNHTKHTDQTIESRGI